jgi:hypothetical protein
MGIEFTVDEAVGALKHSSLPSLVVEGKGDMTVYRWLERELGTKSVSLFPVGGRSNVFKVLDRRTEFPKAKVAFLVDSDLEVFRQSGSAAPHPDVIWTKGYSIENDLLASRTIEVLLEPDEERGLQTLLNEVCRWFAFEVQRYLDGQEAQVKHHVNVVVPIGQKCLCPKFCRSRGYAEPPPQLAQKIRKNYLLLLRGHNLLGCYLRFLSSPSRGGNKYSTTNLLDISTKFPRRKRLTRRLIAEVEGRIA